METEDHSQQQQQSQRSSTSSITGCGTRSCRKVKPKKIPQRGLGVAQLEKIRLEEQQKSEIGAGSSSCFLLPLPGDGSSPDPQFMARISPPNLDIFSSPPPPFSPPVNPYLQRDVNTQVMGSAPVSMIWNGFDFDHHDAEARKADQLFESRSLLHNDLMLGTGALTRKQLPQLQQLPSLVNVLPPSSSSGVNLQMEPPSNQSYFSNPTPMWAEEERIVGVKRPCPFSVENPPGGQSPFFSKLPAFPPPPFRWEGAEAMKLDSGNVIFREGPGPSSGVTQLVDPNPEKCRKHYAAMDGGFLTLGPSSSPSPKFKQPISHFATQKGQMDSQTYKANMPEASLCAAGLKPLEQEQPQPFYRFFPTGPMSSNSATSSDWRTEGGDGVDLNLKL